MICIQAIPVPEIVLFSLHYLLSTSRSINIFIWNELKFRSEINIKFSCKVTHNHFHNILKLMFYQIFLSSQVKRCTIITYKHGVYELPHELSSELRIRILEKLGNIRKVSKPHRIIA